MKELLINWLPIIAFAIGWIIKSPVFKDIPAPIAAILARLTPQALDRILAFLKDPEVGRSAAIEFLRKLAWEHGIRLDDDAAKDLINALIRLYGKTLGDVRRLR